MEVVQGKTTQAEIAVQVPVAMKEVAAMTKHQCPQKIKVISISYCPHARALTNINDRGKVGRPSNGRGRSPRLYKGNRLSRGH